MVGSKRALLIGTDTYTDEWFRQLRAPSADVNALEEVLKDPEIGDFTIESSLYNAGQPEVARTIGKFFTYAGRDDLLLLYISCHGVKDDSGQLYLAMTDSDHSLLSSTAVSARFIRDLLDNCRSRHIVVILDCCYSGAFPKGFQPKAGDRVDVLGQFGGRG